ncbi:MAG: filamentous hemagglutinin N-terminal domain-containing protein [Chlamydiae bacterium]|nr:filamentous hemagglutinin N-terminal domain-containing protein [Chlamydiota bacterium]
MKKFFFSFFFCLGSLAANPVDPNVMNGEVFFSQNENTLNIKASDKSIINWKSYSIENGEITRFIQPTNDSLVLNRVIGQDPSKIFGSLEANGKVLLLNPNGILIGETGKIDVGGLLASTLNLKDEDFLASDSWKMSAELGSSIINLGKINSYGDVYLISQKVENIGDITSTNGKAQIAVASSVIIQPKESESVYILSDIASLDTKEIGINNSGLIKALQAELKTDRNPYELAIKHTGTIEAVSLEKKEGAVYLTSKNGKIDVGGKIIAQKELNGGDVKILAKEIVVEDGAIINTSNKNGGGNIYIGEKHGCSDFVDIKKDVIFNADAYEIGNGGKIVVNANNNVSFLGNITAVGGSIKGNGGFVEISSKNVNILGDVKTGAVHGKWGMFYIDPTNVAISDVDQNVTAPPYPPEGGPYNYAFDNATATISASHLVDFLNSNNVTINTDNQYAGEGDITISNDVVWSSDSNLTLIANRNIFINAKVENSKYDGLDFFTAKADRIDVNNSINAVGSNVKLYIGQISDGILNLNENINAATISIYGGSNNNTFNIAVSPYIHTILLDGGPINLKQKNIVNKFSSATWNISGENFGSLGMIAFSNINKIVAAESDSVTVTGGGSIDRIELGEHNTFNLNGGSVSKLDAKQGLASININDGSIDFIVSAEDGNNFTLSGGEVNFILCNSGSNKFYFNGGNVAQSIIANIADDFFYFINGHGISGSIDGGGGINEINYNNYGSFPVVNLQTMTATGIGNGFSNINSVVGDQTYFGKVIADNNSNTWNITSDNAGNINDTVTFAQISQLFAGDGDDTFNIRGKVNEIFGGNGNNIFNIYGAGNVSSAITGGSVSDTFNLFESANIDGKIIGGSGDNLLSYQNYGAAVTVDVLNQAATGIGQGFSNIQTFIGDENYFGTFKGDNTANVWTISGINSGDINGNLFFSNFDHIVAGNNVDNFYLNSLGSVSLINGGGGNNTYYINGGDVSDEIIGNGGEDKFLFSASNTITGSIDGGSRGKNILDYSGFNLNVDIDLSLGRATGVGGGFSNIDTIIGNCDGISKVTTIKGNDTSTWTIDKVNGGKIISNTTIDFSNASHIKGGDVSNTFNLELNGSVEKITGGIGNNYCYFKGGDVSDTVYGKGQINTFYFENGASITGAVNADDGTTNTLNYQNFGSAVTVNLQTSTASGIGGTFSNIQAIVGDSTFFGNIIGLNSLTTWNIKSKNGGDVDNISFSNINILSGKNLGNAFYFYPQGVVDSILCEIGGINTLDYSNYAASISINLQNNQASGITTAFTNINTIVGSADYYNSLKGFDNSTWNITGAYIGTVEGSVLVNFSNITDLLGGDVSNIYTLGANAKMTSITGGAGSDTFYLIDQTIPGVNINAGYGGVKELNYENYGSYVQINLSNSSASGNINIQNFNKFVGDSVNFGSLCLLGNYSVFNITGANLGNINNQINFSKISDLTGSGGNNTFHVSAGGSITGTLTGQGSGNTLDFTGFGSAIAVDLSQKTATAIGDGFSDIQAFIGDANFDNSIKGEDYSTTWNITGNYLGTVVGLENSSFTNFIKLIGGSLDNNFNINGTMKEIRGGSANNYFNLTAGSVDKIAGGKANIYTIQTGCNVTTSIVGGSGEDTFIFNSGAAIDGTIDGGSGGVKRLNYQNYGAAISIDLTNNSASGTGGISNINNIIGDQSYFGSIKGPDLENTWSITDKNKGSINDTISFSNISNITGSNTNDTFVFSKNGCITGNLDGGSGLTKKLDLSSMTSVTNIDFSANTASKIRGFFSNINYVIGSATNQGTLKSDDLSTSWKVTNVNSGEFTNNKTIQFFNFSDIVGTSGSEIFEVTATGVINSITGGPLDNTFYFKNGSNVKTMVTGGVQNNTLNYQNYGAAISVDLTNNTASGAGGILNINSIVGDLSSFGTLKAPNQGNIWNITGTNTGSINDMISFSNISNLIGSNTNDTFVFSSVGSITGNLDGGSGLIKKLDFSSVTSAATIDFGANTASKIGGLFSNINYVIGSSSNQGTLKNDPLSTAWKVTDVNGGNFTNNKTIQFFKISDIVGTSGSETFEVTATGVINSVTGGPLDNTFSFKEGGNVTTTVSGGAQTNTFYFYDNVSIDASIMGVNGSNSTLNYENFTGSSSINFRTFSSSGFSGSFSNINNIIGNGTSKITGPTNVSTWNITGKNSGNIQGDFNINFSKVNCLIIGPNNDTVNLMIP